MCLKISGGVKQVLNVVEHCKAIPYVGNLIKFSGIPEEFGRMAPPAFKCYTHEGKLMAEGSNTVPLADFFSEMSFDEEYPGLYSFTPKERGDTLEKAFSDVKELAAEGGFQVEV